MGSTAASAMRESTKPKMLRQRPPQFNWDCTFRMPRFAPPRVNSSAMNYAVCDIRNLTRCRSAGLPVPVHKVTRLSGSQNRTSCPRSSMEPGIRMARERLPRGCGRSTRYSQRPASGSEEHPEQPGVPVHDGVLFLSRRDGDYVASAKKPRPVPGSRADLALENQRDLPFRMP